VLVVVVMAAAIEAQAITRVTLAVEPKATDAATVTDHRKESSHSGIRKSPGVLFWACENLFPFRTL
jgi:hypothetical protein